MAGPFPCCCVPDYCPGYCTPGYPLAVTVDIQGAANDQCTDWPSIDGAYTIPSVWCGAWYRSFYDATGYPTSDFSGGGAGCGTVVPTYLGVFVHLIGSTLACTIETRTQPSYGWIESHTFRNGSLSLPLDCCSWSSEGVAYLRRSKNTIFGVVDFGGDLSGATCNIRPGTDGC